MSSSPIVISGSGLWTPAHTITNAELIGAYNRYAEQFNAEHADAPRRQKAARRLPHFRLL